MHYHYLWPKLISLSSKIHVATYAVASPGGFQGFLEANQAPTIVYSIVQLASYSLRATGSGLSLVASFMPNQHWCKSNNLLCMLSDDVITMNMINLKIFAVCQRNYSLYYFLEMPLIHTPSICTYVYTLHTKTKDSWGCMLAQNNDQSTFSYRWWRAFIYSCMWS